MIYKTEFWIDDDNRPQYRVISGRSEMELQEKCFFGQCDRLPSFDNEEEARRWGKDWEEMECRMRE